MCASWGPSAVTLLAVGFWSFGQAATAPASRLEPDIQGRLEASEYEVSWQGAAGYQAPNRAQGFRTTFTESGIRAVPRVASEPGWEWGLHWIGYGRGKDTGPVPEPLLSPAKNRIEYRRDSFTEWYENRPDGLEQGFVLPAPPEEVAAGDGSDAPLHLELALSGTLSPVLAEDGQAIDFVGAGGARVLRYGHLHVTDARGSVLPSWMEGFARAGVRGIRLMVDAKDAVYPLTVDPLTQGPVWTNESNQASAEFGRSVGTAGDVNGDGYSDVIIGAPFYDNGQTDEGRVYVYHGSASGLPASPAWFVESDQVGARFGLSVATAGDVNGDGYADVIVGAPLYDNEQSDEGRAFVYLGSPTGLALTPAWTKEIDQASANFGASVAPAGDVNNDGYADVIVGAYLWDNGQTNEGGAFAYLGSPSGLAATAVWTTESNQANARYGWSVATAGDANRDGFADVLVGAPQYDNVEINEGRAFLYPGNSIGISSTALWAQEGNQTDAQYGYSVATAGDTNGDGYADFLVGAWQYTNPWPFEGRAFLYAGAPVPPLLATWTLDGGTADSFMGYSVGTAGDINGDGYADIVVAAPFYATSPTVGGGQVRVYGGSASGLSEQWTTVRSLANAAYGWSVATAGDVNGDGYADLLIGAPWDDNGQTNEGIVYLYTSSGALLGILPMRAESNQPSALMGLSVSSAGDVNGDGYGDFVVGAPLYDNGPMNSGKVFLFLGSASGFTAGPWNTGSNQAEAQFGAAVGTAGDVNGDGYSDVVVGAPLYDDVQANDGRAYLFLGSAGGLATTPAWTGHGAVASGAYGAAVGTAGDVNGDGFADFLVGAPLEGNVEALEGRAYLYLGAAGPVSTSPAWTAESNQANARFGTSVATAADVNRDGYSDVVVGAPRYSNGHSEEGRASLYLGSAAGLPAFASWSVESGENEAHLGTSVASAGDVNGDGYADVIVGTPHAFAPHADVYHGSASGLPPTASFTFPASAGDDRSQWGFSVAGVGDVNGDGYSDVLIGAPTLRWTDDGTASLGEAVLYFGSATGVDVHPFEEVGEGELDAQAGYAVAPAGDLNGDGYADVLVGAPFHDDGEDREGRIAVYFGGGGGTSIGLRPRARASDDSRPIARWGTSDSSTGFRLAAFGRTPFGRVRVRLQWEVKPLGTPLDGTGTAIGSLLDTGPAGVAISQQVAGLTAGMLYHWRVRLLYDPASAPFAQKTRWLTVPWGGVNEAMLRTSLAQVAAGRSGAINIAKVGLGITMSWAGNASCNAADTDHAIYEGTLGNFGSHMPVTCATNNGHTWNFTPQAGNRYFLLVPINVTREGSYGLGAGGAERPASASACKPQLMACP